MPITIPGRIFFRIGDVARLLELKAYVIRFWETEFAFVAPAKGASGQRVYQRPQIEALILVKHLLYSERYSIEGAKKRISELKKAGKYREMIDSLVEPSAERLKVGSVVPKAGLSAFEERLRDLQTLIREPSASGHEVPGLKPIQ